MSSISNLVDHLRVVTAKKNATVRLEPRLFSPDYKSQSFVEISASCLQTLVLHRLSKNYKEFDEADKKLTDIYALRKTEEQKRVDAINASPWRRFCQKWFKQKPFAYNTDNPFVIFSPGLPPEHSTEYYLIALKEAILKERSYLLNMFETTNMLLDKIQLSLQEYWFIAFGHSNDAL